MSINEFLKELPKCEHHVHLEGTLSPELLFTLLKKHDIKTPEDFPKNEQELSDRYDAFTSLDDFLYFYYIGMSALIDEDDFFQLAWDYFQKAKKDGVHHAEVFFDPQGHVTRGIKFETFLNGFTRAAEKAQKELGLSSKLIMCLLRHLPASNCMDTIISSFQYYRSGKIHGLGLDSSEKPFPPELFTKCFKEIKKRYPNVGLTAHAGEECGPERVTDTLDYLQVERIDHGVQSAKDVELLKRLSSQRTLLTVCPISNLKLRGVSDIAELPLRTFLEYDVPFSLNSDDPAYFKGYILDNYIEVHKKFNFDKDTWGKIAKYGINGSWISEEAKSELCQKVDAVLAKYAHLQ